MTIRIGTAPDSWGVWFPSDERQTPWQRFLDEVAQAEYEAIELGPFGYLPTERSRLAAELERRSLKLAGGTITGDLDADDAWSEMKSQTAALCELLEPFGARYLVVLDDGYRDAAGHTVGPRELEDRGWQRIRETLHRLGEYTAGRGISAVFHPHADTTVQFEPQIERLLELTDPGLVNLCLDVGHHAYAGGDAVSFFRQHHTRVPYLHLKDVDGPLSERARREDWSFGRAVNEGAFVDLGQGSVDIVGLNRAAQEVGFDGWGVVEQDMYPAPFEKPLPIARRNRGFLRQIGAG